MHPTKIKEYVRVIASASSLLRTAGSKLKSRRSAVRKGPYSDLATFSVNKTDFYP
jgi:hypothetical protein